MFSENKFYSLTCKRRHLGKTRQERVFYSIAVFTKASAVTLLLTCSMKWKINQDEIWYFNNDIKQTQGLANRQTAENKVIQSKVSIDAELILKD